MSQLQQVEETPDLIALQEHRMTRELVQVATRLPFFGSLLGNLRKERKPQTQVPTMCVDGTTLFWSAGFASQCEDWELRFVILHEILHCALGHMFRVKPHWDMGTANRAADYAVNELLDAFANSGESRCLTIKLPKGALRDKRFDEHSFEQIYHILSSEKSEQEKSKDGAGDGKSESPGEGEDYQSVASQAGEFTSTPTPGEGDANAKPMTERDWNIAREVARQDMERRNQGTIPGHLGRLLGSVDSTRSSWETTLRRFFEGVSYSDWSEELYDRRFIQHEMYVPALQSAVAECIAVVVDTSGSIDEGMLARFAAELNLILEATRPKKFIVVWADAAVAGYDEFEAGEPVVLRPRGGGGTDFRPALARLEEEDHLTAAVYLTDGYGTFPRESPSYPILWAATCPNVTYPFGEVIHID